MGFSSAGELKHFKTVDTPAPCRCIAPNQPHADMGRAAASVQGVLGALCFLQVALQLAVAN